MNKMMNIEEISQLISQGSPLIIAGDASVLSQLPAGNWIGGTIPYFMAEEGGIISKDKCYVTEIPSDIRKISLKTYGKANIDQVYADGKEGGFSIILLPAATDILMDFSLKASQYLDFLKMPLIGWVTGVHLDDLGTESPQVFYGPRRSSFQDKAVVMHCSLPEGKMVDMDIINAFEPDLDSPEIVFPTDGFSVENCLINGEEKNLAQYVEEQGLDTKLPLVADYNGTMINISFQTVDKDAGKVDFYAPIFKGVSYRQAKPVPDYIEDFTRRLESIEDTEHIFFSCNCILNFLYSELEGKQTANVTGPITFGEVAYQLLNQTLVYLRII